MDQSNSSESVIPTVNPKGVAYCILAGAIIGFFSSAVFALGPMLILANIRIYRFELCNVPLSTLDKANAIISEANSQALYIAVMQHGFDCMIGGAFWFGVTYCVYAKYIHGFIKFAFSDFMDTLRI